MIRSNTSSVENRRNHPSQHPPQNKHTPDFLLNVRFYIARIFKRVARACATLATMVVREGMTSPSHSSVYMGFRQGFSTPPPSPHPHIFSAALIAAPVLRIPCPHPNCSGDY